MKPTSKRPARSPTATRSKGKPAMRKAWVSWLRCCSAPLSDGRGHARRMRTAYDSRTSSPAEPTTSFNLAVPAHSYDLILVRPERNTVTLSVLAYGDMEGFVAYGTQPATYTMQTSMRAVQERRARRIGPGSLKADTRYYYQFRWRDAGEVQFSTVRNTLFTPRDRPAAASPLR